MTPYETVTARVLEALERGVVPWRKPWGSLEGPRNLHSGKPYRGSNVLTLGLCAPYASDWWVTFKQARALGGTVKKGEKGWPILFWKPLVRKSDGEAPGESTDELRAYGMVCRLYWGFNTEQTEGLEVPPPPEPRKHDPIPEAETIAGRYLARGGPGFVIGGGRAFYRPSEDRVTMPPPETFESGEAYYSVLFHELTHSTGHRSRLAREGVVNPIRFRSHEYSNEELVAELGASFLRNVAGIDSDEAIEQSAAYIDGWRRAISKDSKLVVMAAQRAQHAADLIRGIAARKKREREAAA